MTTEPLPKQEIKNELMDAVEALAKANDLSTESSAQLMFVVATFLSALFRPETLIGPRPAQQSHSAPSKESNQAPTNSSSTATQSFPKRALIQNAIRYWPSFRDSKLTSWISTVINATVRDINDKEQSTIPEDFDLVELIASSYPA